MPDSEQKTRDTVLSPATPATITPWDNLTIAPSPASTSGLSPEIDWTGDVDPLFSPATETPASLPYSPSGPDGLSSMVQPPSESSPSDQLPLSHEVNQALARLEMNSLEVRLYLDSIEEKIRRMEPRLEQISDSQQTFEVLTSPADPPSRPPAPIETTTDRRRRRLEIPPSAAFDRNVPFSPPDALSDDDPWSLKPWLLARRKQLAIVGTVLAAFVAILTFGSGDHATRPALPVVPAGTPAPAPSISSTSTPKSSADIPFTPPPANTQPSGETGPQLAGSAPPAADPLTPDTAASSSTDATAAATLAPTPGTPAETPGTPALTPAPNGLTGTPAPLIPRHTAGSSVAASSTPPAVLASGRVRVSSGVMAGNLLFSPTPKYPGGFATLFHMEGKVTMQAIIARSGRVEYLRVLSGHHLLRSAAQETVRTWRYRPYLINGVPVEVATIVTVEFHR